MARDNSKAQDLLGKGAEAHQAGQFDKAEKFYKRALKADSNNADALHLLGLISHQKGRDEYAAQLIGKALAIKPSEPAINTNMAIVLNTLQRWPEAERAAIAAIKAVPEHAEAYNNLGRALAAQNKYVEAEVAYDKAIEYAPNNAAAENNLGHLHMQQGRYELAEGAFLRAIEIDGTFLLAFSNLATTYMAMDWLDRAEEVCRTALRIEPNFVPAIHSLGVVLSRNKQFDGAEQAFRQVMDIAPGHSQAISNLAALYSAQSRFDEAEELFKCAIQLEPKSAHAHINLGVCYAELGQMEQALKSLKTAVACDPNNIDAYYALSTSGKEVLEPATPAHIAALLESDRVALTSDQRTKAHFTLAMQNERSGDLGHSFDYYISGNQQRAELLAADGQVFDPVLHREEFDQLKATFTSDFFAQRAEWGAKKSNVISSPIFVIGMPRSGTTLIEQIIAAHPKAEGAGELADIPTFIDGFKRATGGDDEFPASVKHLTLDQVSSWSETYSAKLEKLSNGAAYVVDKTPFNYANLWLIQMMYPAAKIIHCKRDLRDVGLSCFQQNFVQPHPWSCNLEHVGSYIKAYVDLMAYWQATLSLDILDVSYEDLVADPATDCRRIIEFLGLDWQDDVLNFHAAESKVKTASKWQVREPVYQRSVGRWEKYKAQLKPLNDVLGDLK
ncbi:MAG: tetratricopeptide repeat protein [Rhodospirillaceae bacterium]|jgi:Flp pilus assembly protein TadD|nr:tetratricopeptide repeat protein [Rhodospirillaceae bacterium]MBT4587778.1 tetratricopeptide repeat protein [Rhodospirillaceae bacterium]MBT4939722.1 tetratricopeptide repeat protein [Rhodospirillaceae bacterium]MBT7268179.1 tetratricopeptide repeat protein [Rhodospirillaceae bacterium]